MDELAERIGDLYEEVRVRWLLLDPQQKQVILLAGLYLAYTVMDIGGAIVKGRAKA